jgi:hypothetical protein
MKYVKLFEDFSNNEIEVIEDYFLTLSDYKNHDLPINVSIYDHTVNTKNKKVPGYKICIIYDFYDQNYVNKEVQQALTRMSSDYNIHYSQISKSGNGHTVKEIPVYGKNRTTTILDPKWKWIITVTKKNLNESNVNIENIEDYFIMEDESGSLPLLDINNEGKVLKIKFNTWNSGPFTSYNLLYGNIDNHVKTLVDCIKVRVSFKLNEVYSGDIKNKHDEAYLLNKLHRLIILYPDICILYTLHNIEFGKNELKYDLFILPKTNILSESNTSETNLIIVDVQKSFKKYFTDNYLAQLNSYAGQFTNVYQIWDNHSDKDADKDYLYDRTPDKPVSNNDLYTFNNQKDLIEKRYQYDVDVDFYSKILDPAVYQDAKNKEDKGLLRRGDYFVTKEGTIIVYIGNNHVWYHCPKKLYDLFVSLKGKNVTIVGGSMNECLLDIETAARSLGVPTNRDYTYIYSATYCPIK